MKKLFCLFACFGAFSLMAMTPLENGKEKKECVVVAVHKKQGLTLQQPSRFKSVDIGAQERDCPTPKAIVDCISPFLGEYTSDSGDEE